MRIAVIGGGPGGLYFSVLARQLCPGHEITVWERNAPDETFGFGVVLSDQALGGIEHADPAVVSELRPMLARWDDIDVHYRGTTFTAGGNGFAAVSRAALLMALQRRCARLGVPVRHGSAITDVDALAADHDVVVAADGANSLVRERYAEAFRPTIETGKCRYIWLGTDLELDSFAFYVVDTPGGALQIHAYPDSRHAGTLIVELSENAWRAAGFADAAASPSAPGESDERSIGIIAELCKTILNGSKLYGNNSRWLRFPTVWCETWRHRNVVLIGDAAHTAHFSIGSGTKLAMDDASALARSLQEQPGAAAALAAYEAERRPAVRSLQRAARASREWFENVDRYTHQDPQQFAVNLLTRSRRVSYASLRRRDPGFVARAERWFADTAGGGGRETPPMLQPFTLGCLDVVNRVVVRPDEVFPARDGVPGDLHLVYLGGAALAGAGLVLTGPVAVSPTGTDGPGLHTGEQEAGWRRVVDFVHAHSPAKIGVQLGHYGPDGSAEPLGALQRAFAAAARRAAAGFDLLELDCATDRLLAPCLSPSAAGRGRGASLRERLRRPLAVFGAIRAEWPAERPVGLRIAPARWFPAGADADAVAEIANEFAAHGAASVHVVAGTRDDRDAYADRIRNQAGRKGEFAVIAAGSVAAADVDTIVLAGRADLCVVDRPTVNSPWHSLRGTPDRATSKEWS
ncbi:FAD-dependent monooxygenase [Streptomyces spectabilis]|uniref:Anthraniloyl-CoA monooxygenase n=1 Tax=Streptomyces spectabilis TaxID=68270 RepID=A0A5P2X4V7_STRST|nr:FAD-dependent monooxygenase [Streptomyces spectabilis]MBB5101453.1 anthraniloyl-CoA monooxygenase [Streptomyces spectabilis]MCI3900645.1 FAD-dependent monooxygenase [Streptomyces spectabilis]QEV58195.1 bifunctional salicylyl-CoA 5-hydroxylase/oxidoreductase [Streptomyces spectabilis]GGV11521.1 salicylyl-CoA 5-hydroxylase [Streptomyces spectabilis]